MVSVPNRVSVCDSESKNKQFCIKPKSENCNMYKKKNIAKCEASIKGMVFCLTPVKQNINVSQFPMHSKYFPWQIVNLM